MVCISCVPATLYYLAGVSTSPAAVLLPRQVCGAAALLPSRADHTKCHPCQSPELLCVGRAVLACLVILESSQGELAEANPRLPRAPRCARALPGLKPEWQGGGGGLMS